MRLIDIDRFPLLPNKLDGYLTEYERGYLDAQSNMNSLPTIDAVEVVRCKDCKYMLDSDKGVRFCNVWCKVNGLGDNGYCSYGKKVIINADW